MTEIVDDEEDEDDDDDNASGSETSSFLPGRSRSRSRGSSLPTSRKASPMPPSDSDQSEGLYAKVSNAVGGLLGGQQRRSSLRGEYSSLGSNGQ